MIYIARHTLVVGNKKKIYKGQQVQGVDKSEIPGLLKIGAIEAIAGSGVQVAVDTPPPPPPPNTPPGDPNTPSPPPDETPSIGAVNVYEGRTQEEIESMWRQTNRETMLSMLEEANVFEYSTDSSRAELIAALVENNVAPR